MRLLFAVLAFVPLAHAADSSVRVTVDPSARHQVIAGFGVNFDGSYFREAQKPMIDMLIDDLGATIFRFDPYGLTNWESRNDNDDPQVMNQAYYNDRFSNPMFEAAWAGARYLNARGIRPFLNFSGKPPDWMMTTVPPKPGEEPHPLNKLRLDMYEEYAETLVAAALYARTKARINYEYLGPLNETDCAPAEGPGVAPEDMPKLLATISRRLRKEGLGDLKLVVVDQCSPLTGYLGPILKDPEAMKQVAVFSEHQYGVFRDSLAPEMDLIRRSAYPNIPLWLTEYGDLNDEDPGPENEWKSMCVKATQRVLRALNDGASAALFWDAYDNFHEHDQLMRYYGLMRNTDHLYAPKKRYYAAKQLYHFVKPGAVRIGLTAQVADPAKLMMSAYHNPDGSTVIVGVKTGGPNHLEVTGIEGKWDVYQTTRYLDCTRTDTAAGPSVQLAEDSVFTLVAE
ncbi:MAG: glycoside hydrolase family 30 beta sandwich domain-containing protein [Bryobacteraceae bacterium]